MEATKNIYYAKDEGAIDHTTVTRSFKKFWSSYKNLDSQTRLGKLKTVNSEVELHLILPKYCKIFDSP